MLGFQDMPPILSPLDACVQLRSQHHMPR